MRRQVVVPLLLAVSVFLCFGVVVQGALVFTGVNELAVDPYLTVGLANSYKYFNQIGMNTFRIPFDWESIQPRGFNTPFDTTYQNLYTSTVTNATNLGAYVIIDPHNYARYNNTLINATGGPTFADFQSFWTQLASLFVNNPRIIFGLMNEPYDIQTETWLTAANAGITGIRSAGATQLILVPGNGFTGAESWCNAGGYSANSDVMVKVVDPMRNFAFEVHQYYDNAGGKNSDCFNNTLASTTFVPLTIWARSNGFKLFLGEFGAANNSACRFVIQDTLSYLSANSDVYIGFTYWAAGPVWAGVPGDYIYSIEPSSNYTVPKIQQGWLQPYFAGPLASNYTLIVPSRPAVPSWAVYTDYLVNKWFMDYSWAKNYSNTNTNSYTYPYPAPNLGASIRFAPSNYDGLFFNCYASRSTPSSACFSNGDTFALKFYVNGGIDGAGQTLNVWLQNSTGQTGGTMKVNVTGNGVWQEVMMKIGDFGGSGQYTGFGIGDDGTGRSRNVYIDQISFPPSLEYSSESVSMSVSAVPAMSSNSGSQGTTTSGGASQLSSFIHFIL